MKMIAFLLLVLCLQVSARSNAQTITLSERNAPLQKLFQEIKKQSGYSFFYDEALLKEASPVSIDVRNVSLAVALDLCFREQRLTYSIIGNTVVIKKKEPQVVERAD
ncbi:MAG TPA: STN domain-containing protein, partial [Flavisolibacter sp.]|nr:STN domain-containing protein [Flavisolibacter sp.]